MPLVETGFPSQVAGEAQRRLLREGPTLLVDAGFDAGYDHRQTMPPRPHSRGVQALIDTGASASCIDMELAQTINLTVVNRARIAGVGGVEESDLYLAQIHAPPFGFTQ